MRELELRQQGTLKDLNLHIDCVWGVGSTRNVERSAYKSNFCFLSPGDVRTTILQKELFLNVFILKPHSPVKDHKQFNRNKTRVLVSPFSPVIMKYFFVPSANTSTGFGSE